MEDVYKRLARKLDELPNGYPETESGVELKILKKIFTPEDAEIALKINPFPETAEAIAQRLALPLEEMQKILDGMVEKGQIGSARLKGEQVYMLVPFIVGIFEFQLNRLDKELADLVEEYAPSLMTTVGKVPPAVMRVVPINAQIRGHQEVHPYEDIRQTLGKAKSFQVMDCICRKEAALQGRPCKHPIEVCLSFSQHEGAFDKYHMGRIITKDEALAVLDKAEQEGLVHCTYNVQSGQMFVCNCCPCCCGILRGTKHFKAPHLMARSNYVAYIDPDACVACGTCADERCPMNAIKENQSAYQVDPERCIGCGVCTTTCPTDAISLLRKPEELQEQPPRNIVEWYMQRAANRAASAH
uniref:4Fe-4S dicluster domain-containing protein n=1 Tax=Desulfomonile tiedjei TaxID=2358 RepID=A0A7C4ETE4_9BACT